MTPTASPTPTREPSGECVQYGQGIRRSSHFGVQMYVDTRPESKYFDSLVSSRAGWVRAMVPWANTERENTTPDQYDRARVDAELAASKYVNVQMIGTISFAPGWAAVDDPNGPIKPEHMDEFAEFLSAVAERYDGDGFRDAPCSPTVKHWELYNEPDNRTTWGSYPDEYAEMLRVAYSAIKSADGEAKILFGGIAQDWFEDQNGVFVRGWVEEVMAAGAGPYFDVMNIHTYPGYWPERADHFPGTAEKVEEFRQILADYGYSKPMMITETSDSIDGLSDSLTQRQAISLVEILTSARAAGVESIIWFTLYDLPGWSRYHGLVTDEEPPQPKDSYRAFTTLTDFLDTASFVRELMPETDGGENYTGYEFDDPANNRRLIFLWTHWTEPNEMRTQLSIPATQLLKYSIYGDATPLSDASDGIADGKIMIEFGREPVILQLSR